MHAPIGRLTVLYDSNCGFCLRCRRWLESQPGFVPLEFLPVHSDEAHQRFPSVISQHGHEELTVVSDRGGVYRNERAWIMCLYALREYRAWSLRLATPALMPYVRHVDAFFERRRHALSRWFGWTPEEAIKRELRRAPRCNGDECRDHHDSPERFCLCGSQIPPGARYCVHCGRCL